MMELSCAEFAEKLSGSSPVPGGGSAAGVAGALAAALGAMAANLSYGKRSTAEHWGEIDSLRASLLGAIERCEKLAERDAEAFLPLSRAYGLKAATEEERQEKRQTLEKALLAAAAVPMELLERCSEAAEDLLKLSRLATKLSLSDVGCGAALCEAAARCALYNVLANTRLMTDSGAAGELSNRACSLFRDCRERCKEVADGMEEVFNG